MDEDCFPFCLGKSLEGANKMRAQMLPRERVIAALTQQPHDRVPWIEGIVENGIASSICGEPIRVDWSIAPDETSIKAGGELAEEQKKVNEVFGKDNINFNAFAPIYAYKMEHLDDSPVVVGEGMIKSWEDFERVFNLPPVEEPLFLKNAREFIVHKGDYCAIAAVRLGIGATLLSMGLEAFSYAMVDDPALIRAVHGAYADWTKRLIPVLEEIGFDVIWAFDDISFNTGPIFDPAFYEREILPVEREIVTAATVPVITHSDGDMTLLLDKWITLGQDAIHPVQPDVMDIYRVRERLPSHIGIVGNIDMELLVNGEPEEVDALIRERMERLKPSGNYLISSSNSLTDNMKVENIRAMIEAIDRYGWY